MSQMLVPDGDYDFRLPPERGPRPVPKRVPVPGFGRKPRTPPLPRPGPLPRRLPTRFLPGIGLGLAAAGLLDELFTWPSELPFEVPAGYCMIAHCEEGPPEDWHGVYRFATFFRRGEECDPAYLDCIMGQAIGGVDLAVGQSFVVDALHWSVWWPYGNRVVRNKHHSSFRRISSSTGPVDVYLRGDWTVGGMGPDANVVRGSPAVPDPLPEPARAPPSRWQWNSGGPPLAPPRPHVRQPPRKGMKERKARSRAAQIGVALFRALDAISESAEVVDALFDALPADVRKRWSKGRTGRQFLDQAGQYGVGGADWKLQALYHNWHKLDVEQALKNIVQNELEDKIVGGIHRYLPRNTINAFDREFAGGKSVSPEIAISNWVNDLFEGF